MTDLKCRDGIMEEDGELITYECGCYTSQSGEIWNDNCAIKKANDRGFDTVEAWEEADTKAKMQALTDAAYDEQMLEYDPHNAETLAAIDADMQEQLKALQDAGMEDQARHFAEDMAFPLASAASLKVAQEKQQDVPCPGCEGTGCWTPGDPSMGRCMDCDGRGSFPAKPKKTCPCGSKEGTVLVWMPIWGAQCGPDDYEMDTFSINMCRSCFLKTERSHPDLDLPYITIDDTEFGRKLTMDELQDWFSDD